MNIVRIQRLLRNSALLVTLLSSSLFLTACGGGSKKSSSTTSSSSSSSTSSHVFSSRSPTTPGSGVWSDIKVSADHTRTLKFEWAADTAPAGTTSYKLFKQVDANSAFVQIGSDFTAATASDPVSVHLTDWINTKYKVQACGNDGCTDSNLIAIDNAMLDGINYIKASNAEKDDWFGWSVAISGDGNTMAVGAPNESSDATDINGNANNNSPTSGAVYVFVKSNGSWTQQAYLKAFNTEPLSDGITLSLPNARFGYQVALDADGNTLAVSAINEDSRSLGINCDPNYVYASSSASNSAGYVIKKTDLNIGAVYVFKRDNNQWTQKAYIKPYFNFSPGSYFGTSLALSGDGKTLAVGTVPESSNYGGIVPLRNSSLSSSSATACFNFSSSSSTSDASSLSSSSLSSSSSSSANSSNSDSSSSIPGGTNSGAVYLYHLEDSGWEQDSFVKAADAGPGDLFGESLSLSDDGNLLAVGASGEDSDDTSATNKIITVDDVAVQEYDTGAVYVFQRTDGTWAQQAKVKPNHNEWNQYFGTSVALSGDGSTLAVGTPGDWSNSAGANADATDYVLEDTKSITSNGYSLSYSVTPKASSSYGTGATYIFTKADSGWLQQAYLKASNPHPGYAFGSVVSLSRSGDVLAVGSWIESSQAIAINGDDQDTSAPYSGAAYSFVRTGNVWALRSYIKAPNTNANDRFAHALGLDATGEELVIGAHREASKSTGIINGDQTDNSADASGAVYLY